MLSTLFPIDLLLQNAVVKEDRKSYFLPVEHFLNPLCGLESKPEECQQTIGNTSVLSQPLHIIPEEDDEHNICEETTVAKDDCEHSNRRVRFCERVDVVLIPSFHDYTEEDHAAIWAGSEEIFFNAHRSRIEYQFEGCDWRRVMEEKDFILCSDGNLYHPATVLAHLRSIQVANNEARQYQNRKRKQTLIFGHQVLHHNHVKRSRV